MAIRKYNIVGQLQRTVFVVGDRYYETRQLAQFAVDTLCDAGYGVLEIQEYEIDARPAPYNGRSNV